MSEQLEQLKQKHGTVYTLTVPVGDTDETATVYLRKLDRQTYSAVSKLIQKDELMATESLIKSLWVGGDDVKKITDDFDALRAASTAIVDIVQSKQATLKKN